LCPVLFILPAGLMRGYVIGGGGPECNSGHLGRCPSRRLGWTELRRTSPPPTYPRARCAIRERLRRCRHATLCGANDTALARFLTLIEGSTPAGCT
jgi:hypothetical protein